MIRTNTFFCKNSRDIFKYIYICTIKPMPDVWKAYVKIES